MFWRFSAYGFLKNLRLFEPFLLLFFREQGMSFFQIGVLYAVREITTNLLDVPTGILADTVGRRITMVLSMVVYIVSFAVFTFMTGFWPFAVAMFLYGLGDALRSGTHKALIMAHLRRRGWSHLKVEYYGGTRAWSQRGSAINVLLAAALVFFTETYRWIFAVSAIPYLINLVNLATYPRELDEVVRGRRRGLSLLSFIREGRYLRVLFNSSLFMGMFRGTKDYLQPVLKSLALSLPILLYMSGDRRTAILIGAVYALIYLTTSFASENAHRIKGMFKGREAVAINFTYALGSGFVILAGLFHHVSLVWLSVVMFVGLYVVQNVRRPITLSYIAGTVPDDELATALSVESSVRTLYAALLAPLLGLLADALGVGLGLATVGALTLSLLLFVRLRD
ncbi:MAG: MFS transporter [Thermotogae bacterium]|nr:MFS transporter [Thermotogota bacterium]